MAYYLCVPRPVRVRLGSIRLGKVWLGWVRLGKVRLCSVRLDQVRLRQVRKVFLRFKIYAKTPQVFTPYVVDTSSKFENQTNQTFDVLFFRSTLQRPLSFFKARLPPTARRSSSCGKAFSRNDIDKRLGQVRLGQVRLGQARLGQVRLGQVRLGKFRNEASSILRTLCHKMVSSNLAQPNLIQPYLSTINISRSRSRLLDFVSTTMSRPKSLDRDREIRRDLKFLAFLDSLSRSRPRSAWIFVFSC